MYLIICLLEVERTAAIPHLWTLRSPWVWLDMPDKASYDDSQRAFEAHASAKHSGPVGPVSSPRPRSRLVRSYTRHVTHEVLDANYREPKMVSLSLTNLAENEGEEPGRLVVRLS